ncbi:hypothetical protein T439DRAFT_383853 [Meredithblackwellia eburnea MCA 4105]
MAPNVTEIIQGIEQAVAAAPQGANLYLVTLQVVKGALLIEFPLSYRYQLYVLSGAVAVVALLLTSALVIWASRGSFWLFRVKDGYILPHWRHNWTSFAVIFLGLLQGFLWTLIKGTKGLLLKESVGWETLVWIPAGLAGFSAAWTLTVSHIVSRNPSERQRHWVLAPWIINTTFISLPLLFTVSNLGFGLAASYYWKEVLASLDEVLVLLTKAAEDWDGTFDIMTLQPGVGSVVKMLDNQKQTSRWVRASMMSGCGWAGFLFLGLSVLLYFQVTTILQSLSIQRLRMERSGSSKSAAADLMKEFVLKQSLWSVCLTMGAFISIAIAYSAFCLWFVLEIDFATTTATGMQIVTLTPVYIFLVGSFPSSCLLVIRAFHDSKKASAIVSQAKADAAISMSKDTTSPISSPTAGSPSTMVGGINWNMVQQPLPVAVHRRWESTNSYTGVSDMSPIEKQQRGHFGDVEMSVVKETEDEDWAYDDRGKFYSMYNHQPGSGGRFDSQSTVVGNGGPHAY